ncbi:hypothetical protein C6499_20495 [Candidatus Poribacteria bacterium]|nr:MAG: hypothetical protein C6499_20495 [Candidatus Poribacteria bacterium]
MFRDLLSSRWFQGGFAFFVLCVGGSLLYSWHVYHTTASEFAETHPIQQHPENQNTARLTTVGSDNPNGLITTPEDTDLEMSHETDAAIDDSERDAIETLLFDEFFAEALPADVDAQVDKSNADAPVSPNGFGPLPAVPSDYPNQDVWSLERLTRITPEHELLSRVRIKLWNEGIRTQGAVYRIDYGRIYPTTDDVVYIQWADTPAADGKLYITEMLGTRATINAYEDDIYEGIFPPHLTIYEYPDGGIDPYTFLGL